MIDAYTRLMVSLSYLTFPPSSTAPQGLRLTLAMLNEIEQQASQPLPALCAALRAGTADIKTIRRVLGNKALTPHQLAELLEPYPNLDYAEMFTIFAGIMGRSAGEFWQVSVEEYVLIYEGFCLSHNITADASAPLTRQQLAAMMNRFPDTTESKNNVSQ